MKKALVSLSKSFGELQEKHKSIRSSIYKHFTIKLKPRPLHRLLAFLFCIALGVGVAWGLMAWRYPGLTTRFAMSQMPGIGRWVKVPPPTRPYGMTPQAFAAFLRACKRVDIHPYRLGQTIGDAPRSVGYHKRDGVLTVNGQKIDYCAAVDLGTYDLTPQQIDQFIQALAQEGFAGWYRSGPNWIGNEHIHAIYGALEMKPQLEGQVRDFLRTRRRQGKPRLKWERAFRRLN